VKVATWNVNSVRVRLQRVLEWLDRHAPDVLCLQELRAREADFPHAAFEGAGYHAAVFGQKTYNGVAVLSRTPLRNIRRGLGGNADDAEARLVLAETEGVVVGSVYVPNGQEVGSEKHAYKLEWLGRLRRLLDRDFTPGAPLILAGDWNVARDDRDVARPEAWTASVLCDSGSRSGLEALIAWGLVDVFREMHPDGGLYTWWDYRSLAFPRNDGLRLDSILTTALLARRCTGSIIDREARKGEKPSDHAPVVAVFD